MCVIYTGFRGRLASVLCFIMFMYMLCVLGCFIMFMYMLCVLGCFIMFMYMLCVMQDSEDSEDLLSGIDDISPSLRRRSRSRNSLSSLDDPGNAVSYI